MFQSAYVSPELTLLTAIALTMERVSGSADRAAGWFAERFRAAGRKAGGILMTAVLHLTNAVASAMADAFTAALDAGTAGVIQIYTGTIPTDANTAIGAQTLLATLTFSATSFGAASNGVITANAITSDSSADATGTATWARISTQSGGTTICDIDVGTSGATMNFNTVAFTSGSAIACTSFTFTMPKS